MGQLSKRVLDVLVAAVLLALTAPLLALSVLAIRLSSPGPALYRQRREGCGRRAFTMFKLRTMRVDADAVLEQHFALRPDRADEFARYARLRNDPRLIPGIGKLLRRSSLDELPQLWNVLRGEMSLVGPRPLELWVADRIPSAERVARHAVRPGITGLWQVSGRSDTDIDELVRIDMTYLSSWSLWSDVVILVRTPAAVVFGRGAY